MDNIPFGYLGNKRCVDFFMYYLERKSTVETLMSGCPFEISKHKQKRSSWWLGHWQMLIPTCAYCAGCCCMGGRGGATKETGRAALVVYTVGDTCTAHGDVAISQTLFQAIPLMRFYCKTHHVRKKNKKLGSCLWGYQN